MQRQTFDDNGKKVQVKLTAQEKMLQSARYASVCAERAQEQHRSAENREMWQDSFEHHMRDYRRFKKQAEREE